MTPEQKALIDAKREGFMQGKKSEWTNPTNDQLAGWVIEAAKEFPYPSLRREVTDELGLTYKVTEDGNTICCWDGNGYLAGEYSRAWVNLLRDLFEHPDVIVPLAWRSYASSTRADRRHTVTKFANGTISCNCEGFKYHGECWHIEDFEKGGGA